MNYRTILLSAFSLLICVGVFAQSNAEETQMDKVKKLRWKKKMKVAEAQFDQGSYYNAIEIYQMVVEEKDDHDCAAFMLGASYYLTRDYPNAEQWFKKGLELDSTGHPFARYYYAQSLKRQAKYEEAKTAFDQFRSTNEKKEDDVIKQLKQSVDDEIAGCDLGLQFNAAPIRVKVDHLDRTVNNPLSDFGPWPMSDDVLLYAALIADTLIDVTDTTLENTQRFARLYLTQKTGDSFSGSELYDAPWNSGSYHVGNATFSADKSRVVFTKCWETGNITAMHCELWMSTITNGEWSEPIKLESGINGDDFSSTHPQLVFDASAKKDVLYYTSNRSDGEGGDDIWLAYADGKGKFGAPMNAGKAVNTSKDERTPFFDGADQTLYFSSNGHVNIGGFDVFASMKDSAGELQDPVNIGYPLNSSVDDLYYTLLPNSRTKGFLVSNRVGGYNLKSPTCCDDILMFYYPPTHVFVEGKVLETGPTGNIVQGGVVYVYDKSNDSLVASVPVGSDGSYKIKLLGEKDYILVASSNKHYEKKIPISTFEREDGEVIKENIYLDRRAYYPGMLWGVVYYEFDKSKLREDARNTLDSLVLFLKDYPRVLLEVGGHTDSKGDSIYNIGLSNRRAEAVYNYLLNKQIPKEQLVTKGFGESKPVAPNEKEDGSDNPEGREQNRRTEFIILDEVKQE